MKLLFHRTFKKQYSKLSSQQQEQTQKRLKLFSENPFHPLLNNHALHGQYSGYRSINISGDLRALYEPVGKETAFFIIIDTHSNLYSS